MSFGVALRNALGLGLGGIVALFSGDHEDVSFGDLLCEDGSNLVQEDNGLILLEP
jgi:hypothetical protein